MRTRCLLATVVAVGAILVLPSAAGAQVPTGDSVVGSGDTATGNSFSFDVSSGPSGENPTGGSSALLADFLYRSTSVDCLAVSGNVAITAGGLAPNPFALTYYKTTVVDNGPTGDAVGVAGATPPFDCTEPLGFECCTPPTSGNIVVVDAPPLPTSQRQCKNGGWRNFSGFRNQGQCVAFVERGPRP